MTKNFAHRGFSGKYPENTMIAFKKAYEVGADGIELDVQLASDGVVVIIHDERLDRTTNGKGFVKDYTYNELSKLNASSNYEEFNKIPTLQEYFEYFKDKDIITNIELKTGIFEYKGIEEKVLKLIKEFRVEERVIISSFNHFSVLRMKKLDSNIKCGLLTESWLVNPSKYIQSLKVECYHPLFCSLDDKTIKELQKNNVEINTWTVNDEKHMQMLIDNNIDAIITNYPNKLNEILKNKPR